MKNIPLSFLYSCPLVPYLLDRIQPLGLLPLTFLLYRWGNKSNQNPKGHTGNPIVDLFNGREINPKHFGLDFKLQTFRSADWFGLSLG